MKKKIVTWSRRILDHSEYVWAYASKCSGNNEMPTQEKEFLGSNVIQPCNIKVQFRFYQTEIYNALLIISPAPRKHLPINPGMTGDTTYNVIQQQ